MTALPASQVRELRALLVHATLPPGCIAVPVTKDCLAPHLRPGEFAIIDPADCEPVQGELFLVAWAGTPGQDRREATALCQAYRRDYVSDGTPGSAWCVGSLRNRHSPETVRRLVREGRWHALGWVNGPYREGVLERQIRGRVVGILGSAFEEARRLPSAKGSAA